MTVALERVAAQCRHGVLDELRVFAVRNPVVVGVGIERVETELDLEPVGEPVIVGVGIERSVP